LGIKAYQAIIDKAHEDGKDVMSDNYVSEPAYRVYEALSRRGYDVDLSNAQKGTKSGRTVYTPINYKKPAVTVRKPNTGQKSPADGAKSPDVADIDGTISTGTPNGAKATFRYRVVDATDLDGMIEAEINADQTRQRSGNRSSMEQIERIASSIDPDFLLDSRKANDGAPVVSGGSVIAGNGRSSGIRLAYERGNAMAYETAVRDFAQEEGINLAGVKQPVLIREVIEFTSGDQRSFVVESNPKQGGLGESVSEQALLDAEAIGYSTLSGLRFNVNNQLTADSLRAVATKLEQSARGITRTQSGEFDQAEASRRVMAAFVTRLVEKAGKDSADVTAILESDGGKRIVSAVAKVAPELAKLDDDLSLAGDVVEAILSLRSGMHAVEQGNFRNLSDWLTNRKAELVSEPLSEIGQLLLDDLVTSTKLKKDRSSNEFPFDETLREYLTFAQREQKNRDDASQTEDIFNDERQDQSPETYFAKINRIAGFPETGAAEKTLAESTKEGEEGELSQQSPFQKLSDDFDAIEAEIKIAVSRSKAITNEQRKEARKKLVTLSKQMLTKTVPDAIRELETLGTEEAAKLEEELFLNAAELTASAVGLIPGPVGMVADAIGTGIDIKQRDPVGALLGIASAFELDLIAKPVKFKRGLEAMSETIKALKSMKTSLDSVENVKTIVAATRKDKTNQTEINDNADMFQVAGVEEDFSLVGEQTVETEFEAPDTRTDAEKDAEVGQEQLFDEKPKTKKQIFEDRKKALDAAFLSGRQKFLDAVTTDEQRQEEIDIIQNETKRQSGLIAKSDIDLDLAVAVVETYGEKGWDTPLFVLGLKNTPRNKQYWTAGVQRVSEPYDKGEYFEEIGFDPTQSIQSQVGLPESAGKTMWVDLKRQRGREGFGLKWGKTEMVEIKGMPQNARIAEPNNSFWEAWRTDKAGMKSQGYHVRKENGEWQVLDTSVTENISVKDAVGRDIPAVDYFKDGRKRVYEVRERKGSKFVNVLIGSIGDNPTTEWVPMLPNAEIEVFKPGMTPDKQREQDRKRKDQNSNKTESKGLPESESKQAPPGRTKPTETIIFAKPIPVSDGSKIVSYEWRWTGGVKYDAYEGGLVDARVSDFDNAELSDRTGRKLVHLFSVETKDGKTEIVSLEDALGLLKGDKAFKSIASMIKTRAKNKMKAELLEAQMDQLETERDAARKAEYQVEEKEPFGPVKKEGGKALEVTDINGRKQWVNYGTGFGPDTREEAIANGKSLISGGYNMETDKLRRDIRNIKERIHMVDQKIQQKSAEVAESQTPEASKQADSIPAVDSLENLLEFNGQIIDGKVTADQVREAWSQYKENEDAIEAELAKLTMKKLARFQGYRKPDNKADAVRTAHENLQGIFNPGESLSYSFGSDWKKARREQMDKAVEKWTDEKIQSDFQERQEKKAAKEKALTNPETLDEWEQFVYKQGTAELTQDEIKELNAIRSPYEARKRIMDRGENRLSPEQLVQFDEIRGINRKELEQAQKESKVSVTGVKTDTETSIEKTVHTKHGHDLFVVKLADRVDKDVYRSLNAAAKKLGGYYSRYSKDGAIPGFQFKTMEAARQFEAVVKGETVDATEQEQEKETAANSKTAERFRSMADRMDKTADEALNQDRRQNTARQARMAAGAESKARGQKAFATTLRNLADAIESGKATHLDGIKAASHIETLYKLAEQAKGEAQRERDGGWKEDHSNEPATPDQMAKAKYPTVYIDKSTLMQMVEAGRNTKGAKMLANKVAKISMNRHDGQSLETSNAQDIENIRELAKKTRNDRGKTYWDDIAWKFEDYDRTKRMGIDDLVALRAALREFLEYKGAKTQEDPAKARERALIGRKIDGFFPTPKPIIEDMIERAGIGGGDRVLEPSAGKGDIAESLVEAGAEVDAIEIDSTLRDILEDKEINLVSRDFTTFETDQPYDAVIMNPPFENGQDMQHVQRAYEMVKPGGKVVAVMSASPFFGETKSKKEFREWLDSVGGEYEQLPEGSFKGQESFRQTGVNTYLVEITKPSKKESEPTKFKPGTVWNSTKTDTNQLEETEQGTQLYSAAAPMAGWNDESYERVIPRDFFNESKLLTLMGKIADWQNRGMLSDRFVIDHSGDFTPALSESGEMYDASTRFYFDGEPVELLMSYNAGKNDPFPFTFTHQGLDLWSEEVFDENGGMSESFSEIFGGSGSNRNDIGEELYQQGNFLKQMGILGLKHVDMLLHPEFTLEPVAGTGFGLEVSGNEVSARNLESSFKGDDVDFYTKGDDLYFDFKDTSAPVFKNKKGELSNEFSRLFGYPNADPQDIDANIHLQELMNEWEKEGIDSYISEHRGIITLSKIVVPENQRGQGIGTAKMEQLQGLASSMGMTIALTPDTVHGASSKKRLETFYKNLGFVRNTGRNKDFRTMESMIWDPESSPQLYSAATPLRGTQTNDKLSNHGQDTQTIRQARQTLRETPRQDRTPEETFRARRKAERAEDQRVLRAAAESGQIRVRDDLSSRYEELFDDPSMAGAEHQVGVDPNDSSRVLKIAHAPGFGFGLNNFQDLIGYFDRLEAANTLLGSGFRFEGVILHDGGYRVVISQPAHDPRVARKSKKADWEKAVAAKMAEIGFTSEGEGRWRKGDLQIRDIKRDNVFLIDGQLHFIDPIIISDREEEAVFDRDDEFVARGSGNQGAALYSAASTRETPMHEVWVEHPSGFQAKRKIEVGYYRFGKPKKGKASFNHLSQKSEKGVSVYKGFRDADGELFLLDGQGEETDMGEVIVTQDYLSGSDLPIYRVSGIPLSNSGADNEILLDPSTLGIEEELGGDALAESGNYPEFNFEDTESLLDKEPVIEIIKSDKGYQVAFDGVVEFPDYYNDTLKMAQNDAKSEYEHRIFIQERSKRTNPALYSAASSGQPANPGVSSPQMSNNDAARGEVDPSRAANERDQETEPLPEGQDLLMRLRSDDRESVIDQFASLWRDHPNMIRPTMENSEKFLGDPFAVAIYKNKKRAVVWDIEYKPHFFFGGIDITDSVDNSASTAEGRVIGEVFQDINNRDPEQVKRKAEEKERRDFLRHRQTRLANIPELSDDFDTALQELVDWAESFDEFDEALSPSLFDISRRNLTRLGRARMGLPGERDDYYNAGSGEVTIYRAAPQGVEIEAGDWVSFKKEYAGSHESNSENSQTTSLEVDGSEVYSDLAGEDEWVYVPEGTWGDFQNIREVYDSLKTPDQSPQLYSAASVPARDRNARHAELEAKHNAGTITEEETAESQRLVDEAAKDAGFTNGPWYHWSDYDFDTFDLRDVEGAHFGNLSAARDIAKGRDNVEFEIEHDTEDNTYWVWSSEDNDGRGPFKTEEEAQEFVDKQPKTLDPLKVFLKTDNLVRMPDLGTWGAWDIIQNLPEGTLSDSEIDQIMDADFTYQELQRALLAKGIDGVIYENEVESIGDESVFVLSPNQIKSADPFTGVPLSERFNDQSESILFSAAAPTQTEPRPHDPIEMSYELFTMPISPSSRLWTTSDLVTIRFSTEVDGVKPIVWAKRFNTREEAEKFVEDNMAKGSTFQRISTSGHTGLIVASFGEPDENLMSDIEDEDQGQRLSNLIQQINRLTFRHRDEDGMVFELQEHEVEELDDAKMAAGQFAQHVNDPEVSAALKEIAESTEPNLSLYSAATAAANQMNQPVNLDDLPANDRESHEKWDDAARERVAQGDRAQLLSELLDTIRQPVASVGKDAANQLTLTKPVDIKVAQILLPQVMADALASGNQAAIDDAMLLAYSVSDAVNRGDPHTNKRERQLDRYARILARPRVAQRAEINDRGITQDERLRRARRINRERLALMNKAVSKMPGITGMQDVFDSSKFDPTNEVQITRLINYSNAAMGNIIDSFTEYMQSAMLSGVGTQAMNIFANVANFGLEHVIQRRMEAALNLIIKDPSGPQIGEFKYMRKAWPKAVKAAISFAARTVQAQDGNILESEITAQSDVEHGGKVDVIRTAIGGRWGEIARTSFRILSTMDVFFQSLGNHLDVWAQAYRLGKAKGLTGNALEKFMAGEVRIFGSDAWVLANEFGKSITSQDEIKRKKDGGNLADHAVRKLLDFKQDTGAGTMAKLGLTIIFPFVSTPYNLTKKTLRRTGFNLLPVLGKMGWAATVKGSNGKTFIEQYNGDTPGLFLRDVADQAIAAIGLLILSALGEGEDDDEDKLISITGTRAFGVEDKNSLELLNRMKGGPMMVLWKGKPVFSYAKLDPVSGIIAGLVDLNRSVTGLRNGEDIASIFNDVIGRAQYNISEGTPLSGVNALTSLLGGAGRKEPSDLVAEIPENLSRMIMPNFIPQTIRNADPYKRDTKGMDWKARTLNAVSGGVRAPKKVDLDGKPVEKTGKWFSRQFLAAGIKPNEETRRADTLAKNWNDANPNEKWYPYLTSTRTYKDPRTGETVKLTSLQQNELKRMRGVAVKRALRGVSESAAKNPKERDKERLKKRISDAQSAARKSFFRRGGRPPSDAEIKKRQDARG